MVATRLSGIITIRLRVITHSNSSSPSKAHEIFLCRVDTSRPCRDVLSHIGHTIMSRTTRGTPQGYDVGGAPSWDHPEEGGRAFLTKYAVFYRGRPLTLAMFDDDEGAAPFAVVCPAEDGEEFLVRRRKSSAAVNVAVDARTGGEAERGAHSQQQWAAAGHEPAQPGHQITAISHLAGTPVHSSVAEHSMSLTTSTSTTALSPKVDRQLINSHTLPTTATSVAALVAPRAQRQLQSALIGLLKRSGVAEWLSPFLVKAGVLSLGELCTQSAESLAAIMDHATPPATFLKEIRYPTRRKDVVIGTRAPLFTPQTKSMTVSSPAPSHTTRTPLASQSSAQLLPTDWNYEVQFPLAAYAHRLISSAHWTMKANGLVIDWPRRLRSYLLRVDPERALGSDIVDSARIRAGMDGEERAARGLHFLNTSSDDDRGASSERASGEGASDSAAHRGFEQVWWELRQQYEEHLVQVGKDADAAGVLLPPYDDLTTTAVSAAAMDSPAASLSNRTAITTQTRLALEHAAHTSVNEATMALASLLVCCPECKHAFQHAVPALSWQFDELQRAVAKAEMNSIALQKEHSLREAQFSDTIASLGAEMQRLRDEAKEWEDRALLESQRVALLEGENATFRRRLTLSEGLGSNLRRFESTVTDVAGATSARALFGPRDFPGPSAASSPGGGHNFSSVSAVGVRSAKSGQRIGSSLEESIVQSDASQLGASLPPDAAVSAEERKRIRRVLAQHLQQHNPSQLMMVDAVLAQWRGREYELERVLRVPPSRAPKALQDLSRQGWVE